MARRPRPLQGALTSPVNMTGDRPVFDTTFYAFLSSLVLALNEAIAARQMVTSAGAPTASDVPDGEFRVWKNTGAGTVRLFVNDGGTLRSTLLS